MNYIIKTKGKSVIKMSEEEYGKLRQVESGLVHFRNISIDISSIDSIIPESDYLLEKADKNKGTLHDGQDVVSKFGVWYIDDGSFSIAIDSNYYPEVAQDCVPTREEYEQKYLGLSGKETLELMLKGSELKREPKQLRSGEGLTKI